MADQAQMPKPVRFLIGGLSGYNDKNLFLPEMALITYLLFILEWEQHYLSNPWILSRTECN